MKKRIYLSGALGSDKDDMMPYKWRKTVKKWFGLYYEDRFNIFDPVIYYSNHSDNKYTYKEVMRYRFRAIKQSDVLLVNLNNIDIETSDDILYAYLNNVPVIAFSDSNSNIDDQKIEQIDRVETGKDALTKVMMHVAGYF